jgi:hypothetical protein
MINLNETATYTTLMQPEGEGDFRVSVAEQRAMLTTFLKVASNFLAQKAALEAQGLKVPNTLPSVTVTYTLDYNRSTKPRPRIAGQDYRGRTGVGVNTHEGQVVNVKRNKAGRLSFTIRDKNRDRPATDTKDAVVGFTTVRLEGLITFAFTSTEAQAEALKALRSVAASA